jgi:hypothetical protein
VLANLDVGAREADGSAVTRLVATRWFLPAITLAFSVIGLAFGVAGDPDVRAVGWTCVLFFGVGGGSLLVAQALAPPAPAPVPGTAALPDGSVAPAVILGYRRFNPLLRLISLLGAIAGAVVFALAPRPEAGLDSFGARAIVGLGAAYFAVVLAIRIRGKSKGADKLMLAAAGLTLSWAGATTYIPWVAVSSVARWDRSGSPQLYVLVSDPGAVVRSGGAGAASSLGSFFSARDRIPISLRGLGLTPDEVVALAQRFLDLARTRRSAPDTPLPDLQDLLGPPALASS